MWNENVNVLLPFYVRRKVECIREEHEKSQNHRKISPLP